MRRTLLILGASLCAFTGFSQTLTRTYVELADSADNYMKRERWEDAERVIVQALRHEPANPSNWLLWSNLGVVRTNRDNYAGAMEAYEIGLAGAPRSTVLLNNRAWTQLSYGHIQEACGDLDSSLAQDSLQAWPRKMRGLLEIGSNPVRARRDLTVADSLAPKDAAVIAGLADLDAAAGILTKAQELYERSLTLRPDPQTSFKALLIMTEKGNFTEAQSRTISALAKWPQDANLHLLRALQHKITYQQEASEKERKLALGYGADPLLVQQILSRQDSKPTSNPK